MYAYSLLKRRFMCLRKCLNFWILRKIGITCTNIYQKGFCINKRWKLWNCPIRYYIFFIVFYTCDCISKTKVKLFLLQQKGDHVCELTRYLRLPSFDQWGGLSLFNCLPMDQWEKLYLFNGRLCLCQKMLLCRRQKNSKKQTN